MDYTKITILGHEFHDDDWSMMFWHYYRMCCTTITSFIVETLRSMWTIEFVAIIRDATTTLHAINIFVGYIDIFVGTFLIYGCILVFVRFVMGLLGSIATVNKDQTEHKKDATKNKDATENTKDPIENTEANEPSLTSLPTDAVSTATAPPSLVSEQKGLNNIIEQWHAMLSLLKEFETKMREFELCLKFEEFSLSTDSITDDSTTDDSTLNEETNETNDQIEREPPTMAQAKANARAWQRNQVAKIKRQRRQQRQQTEGYSDRTL